MSHKPLSVYESLCNIPYVLELMNARQLDMEDLVIHYHDQQTILADLWKLEERRQYLLECAGGSYDQFKIPENFNKPVTEVLHSELTRYDEDSAYKSKCPFCSHGILLFRRNNQTYKLQRLDNCISCGQHVKYTDNEINGETLDELR